MAPGTRGQLNDEVDRLDWTKGVGPKLKQMLRRAVGVALPQLRGLGGELGVRQAGHRGLERIDAVDVRRVLLEQPLIAAAEYAGREPPESFEDGMQKLRTP